MSNLNLNSEEILKKISTENLQLLDALIEGSPLAIVLLNKKGEILGANKKASYLFGYNQEELLKLNINNLIDSTYLDLIDSYYKNDIYNKSIPNKIEVLAKSKRNKSFYIEISSNFLKIAKNLIILSYFLDITERKNFEKNRQLLFDQYQASIEFKSKFLDELLDSAPLAIILLNQKGGILRVNEKFEMLFGYNQRELFEININNLIDSEYLDLVNNHYKNAIYNLSTPNIIEVLIKSKKNKYIYVELSSTILKIGNIQFIQSYFLDITERKKFEKNRQLLFDQIQASLEFKSKFLARMSHELRTPLNAILGFSQLLMEESYGDLNENQNEFLSNINSAGEHLLSLINTILDISKIEAGKFELDIQKFKLKKIIDEIYIITQPLFFKKKIQYVIEGIGDQDYLIADPLRYKQILFNLLSNAIKYTTNGIVKLRVIEKIDNWEFQVIDTGIGIAKDDYDLIFKEFGRIKNDTTNQIPGVGLGLALTKRLINLHGGEVWFESEINKGTTFFFTIPKREISSI